MAAKHVHIGMLPGRIGKNSEHPKISVGCVIPVPRVIQPALGCQKLCIARESALIARPKRTVATKRCGVCGFWQHHTCGTGVSQTIYRQNDKTNMQWTCEPCTECATQTHRLLKAIESADTRETCGMCQTTDFCCKIWSRLGFTCCIEKCIFARQ